MASEYALPAEPEFERLFADLYPGLHDWVLQDIIEWVRYIYERVQQFFAYYWSQFLNLLSNIKNWILEQATNAIQSWWYGIQFTFFWIRDKVYEIWNQVGTIASDVYHNIATTLEGWYNRITSFVGPLFSQLWTNLSNWFSQVWQWISTHVSQLADTIWGWIQETWSRISTFFADIWTRIATWFNSLWQKIVEVWGDINTWFGKMWEWIKDIPENVGNFLASELVKVGEKLTGWLEKDLHEAIKEMEGAESIEEVARGSPFWGLLAVWLARLLPLIWVAFKAWAPRLALFGGILALERTGKLEDLVEKYVTPAFVSILDHFEAMGPMAPQPGGNIAIPLTKVLTTTITGLATFVLAGGVIGLFKQMGLGVVSAMIYDLVSFRTLTAAFMTSLAAVYIAEPVKYYYQSLARPYLPALGHALSLAGEYALVPQAKIGPGSVTIGDLEWVNAKNREEFLNIIKYLGYSDEWGNKLYELADSPAKYFSLRAMADSGFWDEGYYISELLNSGYNIATVKNMVDMFRRFSLGEVKGVMLPAAMTRFREGFSDEATLRTELSALGLPEPKHDLFVFAANLQYQSDFASDMLTSYRTMYKKDMIDEEGFRNLLSGLGINRTRVEGYVMRDNAAKFKVPKVKARVPYYATDEGAIKLKTAKEEYHRDIITAEELYSQFIALEMETTMAKAIVDNEVLLKTVPKLPAPKIPSTPVPYYLTEEGDLKMKAAVEAFRKNLATAEELYAELVNLEMESSLAEAYVNLEILKKAPKATE
jgi:hypothetical protein